jgi:hypothetical protein
MQYARSPHPFDVISTVLVVVGCSEFLIAYQNVVKDAGTEVAVLLCYLISLIFDKDDSDCVFTEYFVQNIPCIDLSLEVAHQSVDVILNHGGKGCSVANLRNPSRQLRVPDGRVPTDELVVVGSELCGLVGGTESELATGALSRIPLHASDS